MKTIQFALLLTLALGAHFAAAQDEGGLGDFQQCILGADSDEARNNCYHHLDISAEDVEAARDRRITDLENCIRTPNVNIGFTNCYPDSAPWLEPADEVRLAVHQDWRDRTEHSDRSWLEVFAASWWKGPGN